MLGVLDMRLVLKLINQILVFVLVSSVSSASLGDGAEDRLQELLVQMQSINNNFTDTVAQWRSSMLLSSSSVTLLNSSSYDLLADPAVFNEVLHELQKSSSEGQAARLGLSFLYLKMQSFLQAISLESKTGEGSFFASEMAKNIFADIYVQQSQQILELLSERMQTYNPRYFEKHKGKLLEISEIIQTSGSKNLNMDQINLLLGNTKDGKISVRTSLIENLLNHQSTQGISLLLLTDKIDSLSTKDALRIAKNLSQLLEANRLPLNHKALATHSLVRLRSKIGSKNNTDLKASLHRALGQIANLENLENNKSSKEALQNFPTEFYKNLLVETIQTGTKDLELQSRREISTELLGRKESLGLKTQLGLMNISNSFSRDSNLKLLISPNKSSFNNSFPGRASSCQGAFSQN